MRVLVVEDIARHANRIAEGLRDHFKALLKANEKSWLLGYAETSH